MQLTLAERIKIIRLRKGIKQSDLSCLTGIPQSVISGYEIGKHEPSVTTLIKIASALGVSINEIVGESGGQQA